MAEGRKLGLGGMLGIGCAGLLLLALLFIFWAWMTAVRTGLVGPEKDASDFAPTRVVAIEPGDSGIQDVLTQSFMSSIRTGELRLVLTEEVMTGGLRETLGTVPQESLQAEFAQVAIIEGDYLEVYVPMQVANRTTALRLDITPRVEETGEIRVRVDGVRLGNAKLPLSLVADRIEKSVHTVIDNQLQGGQAGVQLTDLELSDDSLTLIGDVELNVGNLFNR